MTPVAGLICDGIHVDPLAVRIAWRALGPDRLMLVTDATAVLGLDAGHGAALGEVDIDVSSAGVRTADGTLAGSDLALDQAVRNLVAFTGCTAAEAVATVTTTPARCWGSTIVARSRSAGAAMSSCSMRDSTSSPRSSAVSCLVGEEAWRWKS